MQSSYSLKTLNRVSQISAAKDIRQLSHAQFPGTHCPLFGVALTAGYIKDMAVLLVGTDECTYYTQTFNTGRRAADSSMQDNFWSFAINQDDVVFGCAEKVAETIRHIDRTFSPKAIMIVTTCVLEVIGEDYEALAESLQPDVNAKLLVVRTEHFKCNSHIPGIERTLTALAKLMQPTARQEGSVNILGHRYGKIADTEMFKLLTPHGISVNLAIPSRSAVDEIARATSASLNIVTDFTALPLAQIMQDKFSVPFVYFDKYMSPKRISAAYGKLSKMLGLDLAQESKDLRRELDDFLAAKAHVLAGKRFIYGNTPLLAFEFASSLSQLDMEPLLIQARDLYQNDDTYMRELLSQGHDPYVSRIANIAPLQALYSELKPNIYIGHENPQRLMELGIVQVAVDAAAAKLGFEVPLTALRMIVKAVETFGHTGRGGLHAAV
ncbi:MAG: Nitrogenase molybdenum-iron protein alpha chain [Firmicutes bacterium]|nr:Nitrogenase molybdenum-iron protein alpha chain [candidate division NPL-UPA2 bacterium]